MSNRIPSLGAFINASRSNLFNTYQAGAGVGGTSASTRAALRRRATLKPGTMANPKTGVCQGLCNRVLTAAGEILVNSNGFLFLIGDAAWATIVAAVGSDASGVPVIPNDMVVNTITNFEGSGKTRVQVIFTYSHTIANSTGFTMYPVTALLNTAGHPNIYTIEITQWGSIPFANTNYYFGRWKGKNSATDTPVFLTNSNLTSVFKDVDIPSADFGNIGSWNISSCISINSCFSNAINFNEDISGWNVSLVTDMGSVFEGATAFDKSISSWNVSNVVWLSNMFKNAQAFNQNFNGWTTSSLQQMSGMFQNATSFNQDISGLDVSNVVNMQDLFNSATPFNQPLDTWDTSKVTSMDYMFFNATSFNQDLGSWDISNTNITNMFYASPMDNSYNINSSRTLAGWFSTLNAGVSGVPTAPTITEPTGWPGRLFDFSYVFIGADANFAAAGQVYPDLLSTYGPVDRWNVSKLTTMLEGFFENNLFNEDISIWDTSKIESMESMFSDTSFNNGHASGISGTLQWDTSSVTSLLFFLAGASRFNQDINGWNVSNVSNMRSAFANAILFNQNLNGWDTSSTQNFNNMFNQATVFNNGLASGVSGTLQWDTSAVTNMDGMFQQAYAFNQNIGGWNVSNVTTMWATFQHASSFNQDISGWNTSKVTSMEYLFSWALVFNQNIGNWNVGIVTNMSKMFYNALNFNQDISGWDISNVTLTFDMFNTDGIPNTSFNQDLGDWNISAITNLTNMFRKTPMENSYNINTSRTVAGWVNRKNSGASGVPATVFSGVTGWPGALFDFSYVFIGADANFATAGQAYTVPGAAPYGPVGRWNVSKLTTMAQGFQSNTTFNEDISMWDTANVTQMWAMFYNNTIFNQDISNWDTGKLENTNNMFHDTTAFNQDISGWNISSLTTASNMLNNCGMSTTNYSNLLVGWAAQSTIQPAVTFGASGITYNAGAVASRAILTGAPNNWVITDGGVV